MLCCYGNLLHDVCETVDLQTRPFPESVLHMCQQNDNWKEIREHERSHLQRKPKSPSLSADHLMNRMHKIKPIKYQQKPGRERL